MPSDLARFLADQFNERLPGLPVARPARRVCGACGDTISPGRDPAIVSTCGDCIRQHAHHGAALLAHWRDT